MWFKRNKSDLVKTEQLDNKCCVNQELPECDSIKIIRDSQDKIIKLKHDTDIIKILNKHIANDMFPYPSHLIGQMVCGLLRSCDNPKDLFCELGDIAEKAKEIDELRVKINKEKEKLGIE